MALPLFNFSDRNQQMMQSQWASQINPVLANPLTSPRILKNIALTTGVNVINTGLQAMQQGWIISDQSAAASIYRSAAFNDLTLTLTSSAPCTINLVVY
jgi:hypothetical protein